MDTRWKRFRYGTDERNPAWSFWGAVVGVACSLFFCAMAENTGNMIWVTFGAWLVLFSIVSLRNVSALMKNEKKNVIPVEFLDRTYPDLVLVVLFLMLLWNRRVLWRSYCRSVNYVIFTFGVPECSFSFFLLFFSTGILVFFTLVLYLSVVRHLTREKLRKKLCFFRMKSQVRDVLRRGQKRWRRSQEACLKKGDAAKYLFRRLLSLLAVQSIVGILLIFYCWDTYWLDASVMSYLILEYVVLFLLDGLVIGYKVREIGVLLDEISYVAKDISEKREPMLHPYSLFRRSEEELLKIREHKRESMERQLQSERMKVELITNVSHDLKTPLTSMIGCIDLLKQVEELPKEAQDYVELLSGKAGRLREMIQDVFEMAKAASGGQDLVMEQLDMVRLIRQTMAEMQDRIEESGLMFRVKMSEEEMPFWGDSKKMYRVYQNLLENALKYSMERSRVYVEVWEEDGRILTSVKNTSACEMEFTAEEIMERFTRGDKSRSTEGNGLGIAIAKSFTEACKGSFSVTIDGDLFKVQTVFPKAEEREFMEI